MADRNLRYNVGAQDTASAVFDKVARSSSKAHKSMQGDIDQSKSKFGQFTQVVNKLADEVDETVDSSVQAINRLESALGDDLEISAREAMEAIERAGLSAQDVIDATDDEVRQLAQDLERIDSAAKRFGDDIETGGRRASAGLDGVRDSGDQSRSVLANLVGNSSQDLGELGGVAGTAGVAIGQMAEYAVDGNIALRNLAGVAGPLALLTVAGVALGKVMQTNAEKTQRAKEVQEGYTEAILDTENAQAVTSETAKNFLEDDAIRNVQDMGANLDVLARSVTGSGDDIEDLGDTIMWLKENVGDGEVSVGQFDEAMSDAGVSSSALSDEIRRLAASGELELDQIEALEEALKTLNNGYNDGAADVEARRAIEEALGVTIEGTGGRAEKTGVQVDLLAAATQRASDAADEAADQLSRANDELADLFDISDSLPVIEDNLAEALRNAADEAAGLAEANASGEERYSAFLDMVEGGTGGLEDYIARLREEGLTTEEAAARANDHIGALFDLAGQYGLTEQQANDLREEMGLMPEQVTTTVNAVGVAETEAWLAAVAAHMAELDGMQATIRLRNEGFTTIDGKPIDLGWINAQQTGQAFAIGTTTVPGPIGAPVPAVLHGGEQVVSVEEQRRGASTSGAFHFHFGDNTDRFDARMAGRDAAEAFMRRLSWSI